MVKINGSNKMNYWILPILIFLIFVTIFSTLYGTTIKKYIMNVENFTATNTPSITQTNSYDFYSSIVSANNPKQLADAYDAWFNTAPAILEKDLLTLRRCLYYPGTIDTPEMLENNLMEGLNNIDGKGSSLYTVSFSDRTINFNADVKSRIIKTCNDFIKQLNTNFNSTDGTSLNISGDVFALVYQTTYIVNNNPVLNTDTIVPIQNTNVNDYKNNPINDTLANIPQEKQLYYRVVLYFTDYLVLNNNISCINIETDKNKNPNNLPIVCTPVHRPSNLTQKLLSNIDDFTISSDLCKINCVGQNTYWCGCASKIDNSIKSTTNPQPYISKCLGPTNAESNYNKKDPNTTIGTYATLFNVDVNYL